MKYKTYSELESIGIIVAFQVDGGLRIIVKGGDVYNYNPNQGKFAYLYSLNQEQ